MSITNWTVLIFSGVFSKKGSNIFVDWWSWEGGAGLGVLLHIVHN